MRRLLIFLHGYDPRGGSTYYKLYRDQAAKQAALRGQRVTIGTRAAGEPLISIASSTARGRRRGFYPVAFQHWDARRRLGARLSRRHPKVAHGLSFSTSISRFLRLQRNVGLLCFFPFLIVLHLCAAGNGYLVAGCRSPPSLALVAALAVLPP